MSKQDDQVFLFLGLAVLGAGLASFFATSKDDDSKKKDTPPPSPPPPVKTWQDLKPVSSGETVKAWQKLLCAYFEIDWGKYTLDENGNPTLRGAFGDVEFEPAPVKWIDGKFGSLTAQITAAFQRAANSAIPMPVVLQPNGVVDRNTYLAMYFYFANDLDPRKRRWIDVVSSDRSCSDPLGIEENPIAEKLAEQKGIFDPSFLGGFG